MVRTYTLPQDKDFKITPNFTAGEFACKDGTKTILIDDTLVGILQEVRDFFLRPVYIRSGYRTVAYNDRIDGARGSYHCKGMAADIDVGAGAQEIDPKVVSMFLQARGVLGIGRYIYADGQRWIHCDSRSTPSYWIQAKPNSPIKVDGFLPLLKRPAVFGLWSSRDEVKILQYLLSRLGLYTGEIDGKFWRETEAAVRKFQTRAEIGVDGKVGDQTWSRLFRTVTRWA